MFKTIIFKDCMTAFETHLQIEVNPNVGQTYTVPRGDAGGLSREYVLRIPSVSLKATKWGAVI